MRHRKKGRKLGRKAAPRKALIRGLVRNLFLTEPKPDEGRMERIVTTREKAKEARHLAEKLITLGKDGSLHARRRALVLLDDKRVVKKIFETIGPRYAERPGGYTRILRLGKNSLGNNAPRVIFELVEAEMPAERAPVKPKVTTTETAVEEPVAEEPAAEEPAVEEPGAEESAAPEAPAESEEADPADRASSPDGKDGPADPSQAPEA